MKWWKNFNYNYNFFQLLYYFFLGKRAPLMIMLNYKSYSKKSANEKILSIEIKNRKIVNQFTLNHVILRGEIRQNLALLVLIAEIKNTFYWQIIYTKHRKKWKIYSFHPTTKNASLPSKNKSKHKNIKVTDSNKPLWQLSTQ